MPNGEYDHLLRIDPIDDAIWVLEDLAMRDLANLGDDAPALREPIQRADADEEFAEPLRRGRRPIFRNCVERFGRAPLCERRPDDLHFRRARSDLATAA